MQILILYSENARITGTVSDHLLAFKSFSKHNIVMLDSWSASGMDIELDRFDAVVFHYSIILSSEKFIGDILREKLSSYRGVKILFIQDEMRFVDSTVKSIKDIGVSCVFTVVPEDRIRNIYSDPYFDHVVFAPTLTGYVPESLLDLPVPDYAQRAVDVSYRARRLSAWYGYFGQEKWKIGERFAADAGAFGLKCDISTREADRIYGEKWISFLSNSKAVLGTESGASFIDYSGEIAPRVEAYETAHPDAGFDEIARLFLEGRDGRSEIRAISPRCFEAAALKTMMIMYEGGYSGVLEAGRHYAVLDRDHGNMKEVVEILRSPKRAGEIIHAAHEEIASSGKWSLRAFVGEFDRTVDAACTANSAERKPDIAAGEVHELEQISRKKAAFHKKKFHLALFLHRIWHWLIGKLDDRKGKRRPGWARVIINFVEQRIRPALRKLLLGR